MLGAAAAGPLPAAGQAAAPSLAFDQPAAPLDAALDTLARRAGITLSFDPALVAGRNAPVLSGRYTVSEALARLLAGSDLEAAAGRNDSWSLRRAAPPASPPATETALPEVRVRAAPETWVTDVRPPYAGGQVARGASLGLLGQRDLFDTPVAAKSFTEETIRNQIAFTSNDIAARDASFTVALAAGLAGGSAGKIRGFRAEPFESTYDSYSSISSRRYPLEMIERVEILKGPATIFTGVAGGVGGTINYVSKKPLDAPLNRATALYSSLGQAGAQVDLSRRFGADDAFGLRLNLAYRDGETAIQDLHETNRVSHLAFNWRTDAINLDMQLGSTQGLTRGSNSGYTLAAGVAVPRVPEASKVGGAFWDTRDQREEFFRAAIEARLSADWSAYAVLGAGSNYEYYVGLSPTVIGPDGSATGSPFTQQGKSDWGDNYNVDLGLRGTLQAGGLRHRLTLAVSRGAKKSAFSDLAIDPTYVQPPLNIYDPASYDSTQPALRGGTYYPYTRDVLTSATVADELELLDGKLRITGGLRYTRFDNTFIAYAAPATEPPTPYVSNDVSPSIGVLYKLTPAVSVYGNYLKAVEAGSIAPADAVNAGDVIPPGVARQYEAGVKADLGSFGATAAVFDIERPSTYLDPDTLIYDQFGRNRHRGVEFDVFGEPTQGLRTQFGFMLLDAKVRRNQDPALVGKRPIAVPARNVIAGLDADVPGIAGLAVLANLRWSSKQYYDAGNDRSVPSYTVLDLGARWAARIGPTQLATRVALGNALGSDSYQSTDFTLQPGAPRTLRVSLEADF